jgi:hypothetical protein
MMGFPFYAAAPLVFIFGHRSGFEPPMPNQAKPMTDGFCTVQQQ